MTIKDNTRIAFITTVSNFGGAEGNLLRLISQHKRDGLQPAISIIHSGNGLADRFREANLPVSEFTLYGWQWHHPWRYAQSFLQLTFPIITSQANLIHINHHYALEYTTRAAKITGRPYLIQMRGVEGLDWVRENLAFLKGAVRVVAVAEAVKARLVEGGVPEDLVEVIYDGVNVTNFTDGHGSLQSPLFEGRKTRSEDKLVGIVGRVVPIKGIADFLRAAAVVAQVMPDSRFVVVGRGPEDFKAQMRRLAREMGIHDRVLFAGFRQDVAAVLQALDVLVLATDDREGECEEACPNIVLEAMASGTPIVATTSGGVVELLADGRGILVPPGDPEELAQGIRAVLSMSKEQRDLMMDRAYKAVCKNFTIQKQARRFQDLYLEILAEARSK